jgi:hypothetical protein
LCDEYRRQSVDAWKLNESVELKKDLVVRSKPTVAETLINIA